MVSKINQIQKEKHHFFSHIPNRHRNQINKRTKRHEHTQRSICVGEVAVGRWNELSKIEVYTVHMYENVIIKLIIWQHFFKNSFEEA
jgi:hypothetical protein